MKSNRIKSWANLFIIHSDAFYKMSYPYSSKFIFIVKELQFFIEIILFYIFYRINSKYPHILLCWMFDQFKRKQNIKTMELNVLLLTVWFQFSYMEKNIECIENISLTHWQIQKQKLKNLRDKRGIICRNDIMAEIYWVTAALMLIRYISSWHNAERNS